MTTNSDAEQMGRAFLAAMPDSEKARIISMQLSAELTRRGHSRSDGERAANYYTNEQKVGFFNKLLAEGGISYDMCHHRVHFSDPM